MDKYFLPLAGRKYAACRGFLAVSYRYLSFFVNRHQRVLVREKIVYSRSLLEYTIRKRRKGLWLRSALLEWEIWEAPF